MSLRKNALYTFYAQLILFATKMIPQPRIWRVVKSEPRKHRSRTS